MPVLDFAWIIMELAGLAIAFTLIFVLRLRDFNYALTIIIACLIIG